MSYYPKDTTPINGSTNGIESNAVYDALHGLTPYLSYVAGTSWCRLGSVVCPINSTTHFELKWIGSLISFKIKGTFVTGPSSVTYREAFIEQGGGGVVLAGTLNPTGTTMEVWYSRAGASDAGYVVAETCTTPFTFVSAITDPSGGVTQAPSVRTNATGFTVFGSDAQSKFASVDADTRVYNPLVTISAVSHSTTAVETSNGTTVGGVADHCRIFTGLLIHTYTMPSTATSILGRRLEVKNKSYEAITIQRFGTDKLDGSTGVITLPSGGYALFVCNETDWVRMV